MKYSKKWKEASWLKQKETKRPLSKFGLTKVGLAAQLATRNARAAPLEDLHYVARVLARMEENEGRGVDRRAQGRRQKSVVADEKKTQVAQKAANPRMKSFDAEARSALAAASDPAVPLLNYFDVTMLVTTGSSKADKGGAFSKELRAKEIEARKPGYLVPRSGTTGDPNASAAELLIELVALEIERLNMVRQVPRDDKGKPVATVTELAAELGVLKGGKALLERLTGFDGEQKEAPLRRARASPPKTGAAAAMMETDEEQVPPPAAAAAVAAAAADEEPAAAADGARATEPLDEALDSTEEPVPSQGKRRAAPQPGPTSPPTSPARNKAPKPQVQATATRQSARGKLDKKGYTV